MDTLVAAIPAAGGFSWSAYQDPSFFPVPVTYNNAASLVENVTWVKELLVGNTGFEGFLYKNLAKTFTPASLYGLIGLMVGQEGAKQVLEAYDITIGMDENKFWTKGMEFYGDYALAGTLSLLSSPNQTLKFLSN